MEILRWVIVVCLSLVVGWDRVACEMFFMIGYVWENTFWLSLGFARDLVGFGV